MVLSHAVLVNQGIDLTHETIEHVAYDDGAGLMLVVKGNHVFAYDATAEGPHSLRWTYPLQEGPPLLSLRSSLDGKLLGVQRSQILVEFINLQTGNIFVQGTDKGKGRILGFVFVDASEADVIFISTKGLELFQLTSKRQGLRLRETIRLPVAWYTYTHETRVLLTASSTGKLSAWQFTAAGMVTLPSFELPTGRRTAQPLVFDNIFLIRVYGRVYCAIVDKDRLKLELHRLFTDVVIKMHVFELFSEHVQLSVVDNVLAVHHTTSSVVMLFDVGIETDHPIANPLPLASLSTDPAGQPVIASTMHKPSWEYLPPGVVLDTAVCIIYRLHLDLKAIAESSSDWAALVSFMQHRRPSSIPALQASPKAILVQAIRTALQERLSMNTVQSIFDCINIAFREASILTLERRAGSHSSSSSLPEVLTPEELGSQVFQWLHNEEIVDAPYLQAVLAEYQQSADKAKIVLPASLQHLSFEQLLQQQQQHQALQLLYLQPNLAPGGGMSLDPSSALLAESPALVQAVLDAQGRQAVVLARQASSASSLKALAAALCGMRRFMRAARLQNHFKVKLLPFDTLVSAQGQSEPEHMPALAALYRCNVEEARQNHTRFAAPVSHISG